MNAAQALEFKRPLKYSEILESFLKAYRSVVKRNEDDRVLSIDIHKTVTFITE